MTPGYREFCTPTEQASLSDDFADSSPADYISKKAGVCLIQFLLFSLLAVVVMSAIRWPLTFMGEQQLYD